MLKFTTKDFWFILFMVIFLVSCHWLMGCGTVEPEGQTITNPVEDLPYYGRWLIIGDQYLVNGKIVPSIDEPNPDVYCTKMTDSVCDADSLTIDIDRYGNVFVECLSDPKGYLIGDTIKGEEYPFYGTCSLKLQGKDTLYVWGKDYNYGVILVRFFGDCQDEFLKLGY